MPLPKRPASGAAAEKAAPPQFGEQERLADADISLPDLDSFSLPDLFDEPEIESNQLSQTSENDPNPTAATNSSKNRFAEPSSTNQEVPKPSQAAVSDVLDAVEDEDEETALNRELGLLDDDLSEAYSSKHDAAYSSMPAPVDSTEPDEDEEGAIDEDLEEIDKSTPEVDKEDDEFDALLRDFEEANQESIQESADEEIPVSEGPENDDWETALSELEAFNDSALPTPVIADSEEDDDEEDDEDEEEDGDWNLEEFTPPANPFESIPEDFQNSFDTDDDDEEDEVAPEEDFIPPSDPFANPFADEEIAQDEENDSSEDGDETTEAPSKSSLKDKAAALLSPAKAKRGLADYFAKINAELHGEDPPKPNRRSEPDSEERRQEDESEDQIRGGGARSPLKIFGFLAPIRSFYTAIVNIIFGIITTILGILSKLPLIGFIFKIALEATKVLRAIAQYIPLVFFIGALVAVSYFSVPRDSLIGLPDSGGATFAEFSYDSANNSVAGVITNTGDIIADVQPEFTVKTIQPGLNPVSWVIPQPTSSCVTESVRVDIDSTTKVTAKCSDAITGFIPRVTGELK